MGSVLRRFAFRSPRLYDRLVDLLSGAEDGRGWVELLAMADPGCEWSERTVEGAIRDLQVLGMVSVSGRAMRANKPDPRRVFLTPLGEAALLGVVAEVPWQAET